MIRIFNVISIWKIKLIRKFNVNTIKKINLLSTNNIQQKYKIIRLNVIYQKKIKGVNQFKLNHN